jgi:hypothetical protein
MMVLIFVGGPLRSHAVGERFHLSCAPQQR